MIKKISVVGIVGLPSNYGGFETLVDNLTKNLSHKFEFTVYCSSKSYDLKTKKYNNSKLKYVKINANGIQSILYDSYCILDSLKNSQIILILGVSGAFILPFVKLISKKKIIINVDGLEWNRKKWGFLARNFLKFSENIAVRYADEIIADNTAIKDYLNQKYAVLPKLISYGGDHVLNNISKNKVDLKTYFFFSKYVFKVCRIEPENNIDIILDCFSKYKEKNLVVVGNWDKSNYGKKLKSRYKSFENICLLNPIYNQHVLNSLRLNCHTYIHGHEAGGTNPSLVEAMCMKLPIFCFDVVFNRITTKGKAKYFKTSEELKYLLTSVNDRELKQIANDLFEFSKKEYTWSLISKKYQKIFNNI